MIRRAPQIWIAMMAVLSAGCSTLPRAESLTYAPVSSKAFFARRIQSWNSLRIEKINSRGVGVVDGMRCSRKLLIDYYQQAEAQEALDLNRQALKIKSQGIVARFLTPIAGAIVGALVGANRAPQNGKPGSFGFPSEDAANRVTYGLAGAAIGGLSFALIAHFSTKPMFEKATELREEERLAFNRLLLQDLRLEGIE